MNIKSNYIISLILFLLIINSVQGQSGECDFGCTVVLEAVDCNNLTDEQANSPCYKEACCKRRLAAKKRTEAKNSEASKNPKTKDSKTGTLKFSGASGKNSNSDDSKNEEGSSGSNSRYNNQNSLTNSYNELVNSANRMRANGQAGTPAYNRTMESIRSLESRLGLSGSNSYSSQAATDDLANSAAALLSSIPEADSYNSSIGLSYSLNYVNNINLVLVEGWVWGNLYLDMKFAGVVVPTKGWEYDQATNATSRSELQQFARDNNTDPMDLFVENKGSEDGYSYYKRSDNILGFGGGMGLGFGFRIPIGRSYFLKMGVLADGEYTTLYGKFGYGFEADFCVGHWIIGVGYQTSEYYAHTESTTTINKVIFDDPELIFSPNYSDGLKTLDNRPESLSQIKNHFVIKLAYAW